MLEADPESRIYAGLNPGTTVDSLRQAIANKTVADHLAYFTPKPGDGVLVPAGTVHSLRDLVVFEVQENSDVTFRLFDWDHIDAKTGQPRSLQVDQAMACIDFAQGAIGPVAPVVEVFTPVRRERLFCCEHFGLWRLGGESPFTVGAAETPRVLVCIAGDGQLEHDGATYAVGKGNVVLLPAVVGACRRGRIGESVSLGATGAHDLCSLQWHRFRPRGQQGCAQVILALSANAGQVKPAVEGAVNEFAARGFRSLGVARAEGDGQWQFVGVLPLFDPPREDAKATIATALAMGVKVKMVTGDALAIAKETAKNLDLGTNILDAGGLGDTKHHETAQLAEAIERADGFAQVFPEHKFHIVDVLQQRGHIVGMTGDGVNDAPALKKADCGIAVSDATDAARAAASIVLLTPGLSVIIDASKESRKIFQRMNSYAIYRIAETLRVLFFMTLAILIFNFYPLTAVMIVMLALLNDGAILSIAYDNVRYKDQPETWNMHMVLGVATVLGLIGVASAFLLFYLGERVFGLDRAHIQTLMYLKLSVAGHLTIFLTRSAARSGPYAPRGFYGWPWSARKSWRR